MLPDKQQYKVRKSNKSSTSFDFWRKTLYDNCIENLISFKGTRGGPMINCRKY